MEQKISHTIEIKEVLKKELFDTQEEILIISAFVKLEALKWIDQHLENNIKKSVVVRFRKGDILFGATDYEIIKYANNNGWNIRFDLRLHSKVFVFDCKRFLIGSANMTESGLSLKQKSNIETVVTGILGDGDLSKVYSIYENAHSFSPEINEEMKKELKSGESNSEVGEWNEMVIDLLKESLEELVLTKDELLTSFSINEITDHDKGLLGLEGISQSRISESDLRETFYNLKIYRWLVLKLMEKPEQTLYFGELTRLLHEDLALKEIIYRKDVKVFVANLLNWLSELNIQRVKVDRPNYSQRITLSNYNKA